MDIQQQLESELVRKVFAIQFDEAVTISILSAISDSDKVVHIAEDFYFVNLQMTDQLL